MTEDKYGLKSKTRAEVVEWQAGWKPNSAMYLSAQEELRRRDQEALHRAEKSKQELAWWALIISALSLVIAIVALLKWW
jgi:hypothetical protein